MIPRMQTRGRLGALVGFAAAAACQQDYLFEQVCPIQVSEVQRQVPALAPTPADILFVVDNSGSMADEQENLARSFGAFVDNLSQTNGDYQLAVVTTDQGAQRNQCRADTECGGLVDVRFSEGPFRYRQSTDASGCTTLTTEHGCFRGPDGIIAINPDADRESVIAQFRDAVRVGSCGTGAEQGLLAMQRAVERANGGCNQGFLRPEANLVVVLVSDEPDGSRVDGRTFDDFLEALRQAKGDLSQVRVAAIVGAVDGEPADCRPDSNGAPTTDCGRRVCSAPPPNGSLDPCNNNGDCPSGETCAPVVVDGRERRVCFNPAAEWVLRDPDSCRDCSFYQVEDCCGAQPGFGYVEFAQSFGAQARGESGLADCRVQEGRRTFCIVDAICQADFSQTLGTIARELVASDALILEPPVNPDFPEGVIVEVGRGQDFERLAYTAGDTDGDFTVDFRSISDPATGQTRLQSTLRFLGNSGPEVGEELRVFYVTEEMLDRERIGACAVDAGPGPGPDAGGGVDGG